MRRIQAAFVTLVTASLILTPGVASAAEIAPPPSGGDIVDIMTENADGSTSIQTVTRPGPAVGSGSAQAAQATLFTYAFDFKVQLRGRQMTTGTGRFCNNWSKDSTSRASTTFFNIELWQDVNNGVDRRIATSRSWNPQVDFGGQFCATIPDGGGVYFYVYNKSNDTGSFVGHGSVTN